MRGASGGPSPSVNRAPQGSREDSERVERTLSMMRSIVESSLKLRLLVVAIAVGVMVLGIGKMRTMPVDVLPEFIPTTVEIQTEALGLSAAEVEQMITVPMEQDLLNGVAWLDDIRSESVPGLSRIQMIFEPGTDPMRAPGRARTPHPGSCTAKRVQAAGDDRASGVDEPDHDGPHVFAGAQPDRDVGAGALDHQAAYPGRPRCLKCGCLRPARTADSG